MTPKPWDAPLAHGPINADVAIPGSKSLTNRELVLSALANDRSTIFGALDARDTHLMTQALRQLGAEIEAGADNWCISPIPRVPGSKPITIDCGLAGTVMRFVPAIAALCSRPVHFIADEQANARPMADLLHTLRSMGVKITHEADQTFPLTVQGPAEVHGPVRIDTSDSSQFLSALLLVAPLLRGEGTYTDFEITGKLPSRPHVDMTIEALRQRGVAAEWLSDRLISVPRTDILARDAAIEPDLSNAGPFLAAAVVTGGHVHIPYWPFKTNQAGNEWLRILKEMGADVNLIPQGSAYATLCVRAQNIRGFTGDMSQFGELVPTLAAMCALATTPSKISNIAHLRGHETDRVSAIATELSKLGIAIDEGEDYLSIDPTGNWRDKLDGPVTLHSYSDHRMATFGAILGLNVPGIRVDDIETVSKTMPEFVGLWENMLGQVHA